VNSLSALLTATRKYTISLWAFLLFFGTGAQVLIGQPTAPVEPEPSGPALFDVRELEAANPFALAGAGRSGESVAAPGRSADGDAGFLVDTAYRLPRVLPPLPAAESWAGAPEANAGQNPFALGQSRSVSQDSLAAGGGGAASLPEVSESPREVPVTGGWFFYVLLTVLAYLTLIVGVYRDEVGRLFAAFVNMSASMQLFRDRSGFAMFHDLLLYLLFIISGGALAYLSVVSSTDATALPFRPWWFLLACMGGMAVVVVVKHLQLLFVSAIFPFGGETRFYGFLLGNTNKTLGIALVPFSFLAAYAPDPVAGFCLYGALALSLSAYVYLAVRGLVLSSTYLAVNKFHFLLYLCAVEIAPIAALVKILFLAAGY
jgi:hypothetical protein